MTQTDEHQTVFEKQQALFDRVEALGWPGERPGVLGTYQADKLVAEAEEWERNQTAPGGKP